MIYNLRGELAMQFYSSFLQLSCINHFLYGKQQQSPYYNYFIYEPSFFGGLPMEMQDMDDYHYVMGDMAMLPEIKILHLKVLANRHAFGSSVLHVLKMSSGIRKLMLTFLAPTEVEVRAIICLYNMHLYLLAYHGLIC